MSVTIIVALLFEVFSYTMSASSLGSFCKLVMLDVITVVNLFCFRSCRPIAVNVFLYMRMSVLP